MRRVLIPLFALAGFTFAASAAAEEPFTAGAVQVGGGLNYGLYMGDDDLDPPNPYGVGIGLGAGYTLDFGLYLGGEFNYFLGSTKDMGGVDVSANIMQFGANVGYDVGLSPEFVLRPMIGIGSATAYAESDLGDFDDSGTMIPIGAQALYSMGGWYLSGQLRYAILSVEDTNMAGLILGVGAGASF